LKKSKTQDFESKGVTDGVLEESKDSNLVLIFSCAPKTVSRAETIFAPAFKSFLEKQITPASGDIVKFYKFPENLNELTKTFDGSE